TRRRGQNEAADADKSSERHGSCAGGGLRRPLPDAAGFERVFVHQLMMARRSTNPMSNETRHRRRVSTRREFFEQAGSGLAAIAMASLLHEDGWAAGVSTDPLAPKTP